MMSGNEPSTPGPSGNEACSGDAATLQSLQQNIASMASVMQQFIESFSQQGHRNSQNIDSQQGTSMELRHDEDTACSIGPDNYSDLDLGSSSDEDDKPQKRRRLTSPINYGPASDIDALLAPASSTKPKDTSGDILQEINEEVYGEECLAASVSNQLAGIVNKRWQTKMPSEKLKSLLAKYNRPENCEKLTVPRVNAQIWNNLAKQHKMADVRMSHVQESMVKACIAVVRSLDHLIAAQNDSGKVEHRFLVEQLIEATALLGYSNYEMSLIRRHKLKPAIKKEYADLCSSSAPVTSLLFGDDLNKQLEA
ncbi:uncharacterized protein LOC135694977 [Rhopilema esculentum]|uniref:uncharacterized protein LOC135694977 n=1 Tax=Rhopilema esculentum TaxID=499914 RepID=UPI0031D74E4A